MSVKTVEATLELLTLAHEVVLLRKERAEATVLMEQAADDLEKLKAENERLRGLVGDWSLKAVKRRVEAENLRAENERLLAALENIKWQSADKDNMEFEARITCFQMDNIRAALKEPRT